MNVQGISPERGARPQNNLIESLGQSFSRMLDDVNRAQLTAQNKLDEFVTSPEKDIHGTLIAMEKAGISLRLLLQIRAKLTAAYHEIIRTQL